MSAAAFVEAARPRTLAASVVPVVVGTAASGRWLPGRFAGALVVSVGLQVAVNYANDLFDARRGVDSAARVGPRRAVAAGLVSPRAMTVAIGAALTVAAVAGAALALVVGPELFVVGALAIVAALGYSGGPRPYGDAGLGEAFVFVFFGLVATTGSAYVQVERVTMDAALASVPVGLLAVGILVANNLRDARTDRDAGKITLAVRHGAERTRTLYRVTVLAPFTVLPLIAGATESAWPLVAFAALPLAAPPLRAIRSDDAPSHVRALVATARLQAVFGALLAAGLWLA